MTAIRFWTGVAVVSLALVAAMFVSSWLQPVRALASGQWSGGWWSGGPTAGWWGSERGFGPWHAGGGFQWLPELAELRDLPAGERFSHFRGVQVTLTDRNHQPFTITVTPGTATAVSATSLTLAANDGTTQTFALDSQTAIRAKGARPGDTAAQSGINPNDQVIVVTRSGSSTARAVMAVGPNGAGFGPFGHWSTR